MLILISAITFSCGTKKEPESQEGASADTATFDVVADRFADIQVLRYQVPGFDQLSLKQKQLAYYLNQAGLSGRDIYYDQKYRNNLYVRKVLENILKTYSGDKSVPDYKKFEDYCKQFFFANGIHHHYSSNKMIPEFTPEYFKSLIEKSEASEFPESDDFKGQGIAESLQAIMWDPSVDGKCVDFAPGIDNVKASANNFYRGVTQEEATAFYKKLVAGQTSEPPSWGLNSRLEKQNGKLVENVWHLNGLYGAAIERIVYWLEKAKTVAENPAQENIFGLLIDYYTTGDLKTFDKYSIAWAADTSSMIDFTNGFIETYLDPLHRRGSYESIVCMRDLEATKTIAAISREAQWFEDNSPLMAEHKKKNVKGVSAKVITVIGEVGDAAPSTPIGINLPNSEWIRENYGSKSVSLGNLIGSMNQAKAKSPMMEEFGYGDDMKARYKQYAALAGNLHTDMHEVIGHASGIINPGVGSTSETLKTYAGTLEEARADLVALYYIMDQKLVDIGVMPSLEVGKTEYDYYLINGLITQLTRIKKGEQIEEAHMRNRQMISAWVLEKGAADKVVEMFQENGKTYIKINDYVKLRKLFGDLLREIQRIKSEGDYEAGKNLVETYGVKVAEPLRAEVQKRFEILGIAPYMGFIQPKLVPVMSGDTITDVKIEYPSAFLDQMLEYGDVYGLLPVNN